MSTPKKPKPTIKQMSKHVDYEMFELLRIGAIVKANTLPEDDPAWSSHFVAYAAHFRVFLEFVHSGRPPQKRDERDINFSDFARFIPPWKPREIARFYEADALVAHLSARRIDLEVRERDWGGPRDRQLIEKHIGRVMAHVPNAKKLFKDTAKELGL